MSTSLSKFYKVRGDDTVTLKINIGHAQVGTTTVNLGLQQLVSGHKDSLSLTLPGTGTDLDGKTLFCSTIVADVRSETNQTSVTYEITGGVSDFKQTLQESVTSNGDVIFYTATFRFHL